MSPALRLGARAARLALSTPVLLVLGLLFSVAAHRMLGMDAIWDTANYHIFIGWAALTGQGYSSGAVAQYHSYFNPLLDVVNYLAFQWHPYAGAALHSLAYVAALFVIIQLLRQFLAETLAERVLLALGLAISATGAMTISLFGTWTNETLLAPLILLGLLALLRSGSDPARAWQRMLWAGLALGASVGFKLTAAPYAVGGLAAALVVARTPRALLVFCVGGGLGYFLVDGAFWWLRWQAVGSPLFPFANNLFQSPYTSPEWMSFSRFEPGKILYYLSLPFIWLSAADFSEAKEVRDGRLLLAYAGIALLLVGAWRQRFLPREVWALMAFFVVSFLAWMLAFRIYRYLVVLEMLSGVLLAVGLHRLLGQRLAWGAIAAAVLALLFAVQATVYPNWGRRPWSAPFVHSNLHELLPTEGNVVVFFADQKVSFLAPQLHALGIPYGNLFAQPWWDVVRTGRVQDPDRTRDPVGLPLEGWDVVYFMQGTPLDHREHSALLRERFADARFECQPIHTVPAWSPLLCGLFPATAMGQ